MRPVQFSEGKPVRAHVIKERIVRYPCPGDYDVLRGFDYKKGEKGLFRFAGGKMCDIERAATGPQAQARRVRNDPSPQDYNVKAGEQCLLTKRSMPDVKFSKSARFNRATNEQDTKMMNTNDNYLKSLSTISTAPSYSIGRKFNSPNRKKRPSTSTEYIRRPIPGAFGAQPLRPASSSYTMGARRSPHLESSCSLHTPSPLLYDTSQAYRIDWPNKPTISTKSNPKSFSFGAPTATKSNSKHNHNSKLKNPGPASYPINSMLGVQPYSRHRTYGGFRFGAEIRDSPGSRVLYTNEF